MASPNVEMNIGPFAKIRKKIVEKAKEAKKIGEDDPRKIIHSVKVGIALTLVSLFFYFKPTYEGFGVAATWAVLTVIIVFEYTVGGTLGRGLNRMMATLVGSALGFGAHWIATHSGKTGEPILIAIFVFIFTAIVTFVRFLPKMKARYDYGLLVFILTFCLISVSGYRDDEVIHMAHRRVTTIIIGSVSSIVICILICPVWIGPDLHNLVSANLDKLGNFLEGFGAEYFGLSQDGQGNNIDRSLLQAYKSVLTSRSSEETMANLARWEPCHGQFKFRHPWKQYLKIGNLSRECAYKIEALNGYLSLQPPIEIRTKFQQESTKISIKTGKALKELASTIKIMTRSTLVDAHIAESKASAEILKSQLKTVLFEDTNSLLEMIPSATVASLLIDVIACIEKIAQSVEELAVLVDFKSANAIPQQPHLLHRGTIHPVSDESTNHHIIIFDSTISSDALSNPAAE